MLTLTGPVALSPFRINTLITSLNKSLNSSIVIDVKSCFIHYVDATDLSEADAAKLDKLLLYDTPLSEEEDIAELVQGSVEEIKSMLKPDEFFVQIFPRPGTISPWSSKATNIVQACGIHNVKRVERGMGILITVRPGFPLLDYLSRDNYDMLSPVYDRMTQSILVNSSISHVLFFENHQPRPLNYVEISDPAELEKANKELGLALDKDEAAYLIKAFKEMGRPPTDVELFMFAQVNSEHCRHKIFNASWQIDNQEKDMSLFKMIRNTHAVTPQGTVSAYSDNAAILEGPEGYVYAPEFDSKLWHFIQEKVPTLIKVETHNHPTAVSPFAGAATGSGGEIRDEGAVGRGSKSKCGIAGFSVSDLNIPNAKQPWELDVGKPHHIASSLDIMIEAPLGSAAFNNEFGRPCINGYFRTLTTQVVNADGKSEVRGYHKPIMLAGGMGTVRPQHALKPERKITPGAALIVLGGQSMLIGLGGGAASSLSSGEGSADLDFASVQRGNPEMQRRAQQVIDACTSRQAGNPIQCIHDVGAGGLSNALPELVHDNELGAVFELRQILSLEPGMSPMEIWCNESQERYVLAVGESELQLFEEICSRERAPYAVVGRATEELRLIVNDAQLKSTPIDLEMSVLFGKAPKLSKNDVTRPLQLSPLKVPTDLSECLDRVLALPSVGSKSFLITIGDRTVTGLIDRDQMCGPWQVPVADVGVTATSFSTGEPCQQTGEAIASGENPTVTLINPAAGAKMAVAEALTNISAANIVSRDSIKLSANWMCASGHAGEGAALYAAVQAVGMDLCPALGISIPVGKDSMSMKMKWKSEEVTAPLSLCITAFAPVANTSKTWTPVLQRSENTVIVCVDLGNQALGGSALAQVYNQLGDKCPDVRDVAVFKGYLDALVELHDFDILAYHDRSDGGLIVALLEMAFAARCGLKVSAPENCIPALFNQELGGVFQIHADQLTQLTAILNSHNVPSQCVSVVAEPDFSGKITISTTAGVVFSSKRETLQQKWASTSYEVQKIRDNPKSAEQEYVNILDEHDPGLSYKLTFSPLEEMKISSSSNLPKVAILREQGVNGQMEMAWSFQQAGFTSVDVHMSDILSGRVTLKDFVGIAACGGFSYGDVLGAGNGWAKSVLFNEHARAEFSHFFNERSDTFAFGACNGCQFLSKIKELIPGTEDWPSFERNESEQYEARVCMVEVVEDDFDHKEESIFLKGMRGSKLPIAVAHGEGRAQWSSEESMTNFIDSGLVAARFVDNFGVVTEKYPFNPNGSPRGVTGIKTTNGRVLAMMPHPERVTRIESNSYYPKEEAEAWGGYGPWIRLFGNAREWVEQH